MNMTTGSDRGVSVVIATHNRPELLRLALDGVFSQNHPLEVIIVFDQSDPDLGLLQEYEGQRIRLVRNTRTPGLAGARNTGVMAASEPWIAFCDDDDTWLPEKLAKQFARLDDAGGDVCLGGVTVLYEGRTFDRIPDSEMLLFEDLLQSRVFAAHPSTVLVRRRAMLERIGLVDEQTPGSYGEDHEWLLRAAKTGSVALVRQPLVIVRWHTGSYFADRWRLIIESIDYMLGRYPEFESQPAGMAWLGGRKAFALAALGEGPEARRVAWGAISHNWKETRAYLAVLVSMGVLPADWVLRAAHSRGRGV